MRRRLHLITVGLILLLAALACSAAAANQAFSVSIQSPIEGTLLPVDMPSTVSMQATDPAGPGVVSVELYVDGDLRWASDEEPSPRGTLNAEVAWTPETEGDHTLMAIAYRADGTASPSATVLVTVVGLTPLEGSADEDPASADDAPTEEPTEDASAEPAGEPPPGADSPIDASAGVQARVDTGAYVRGGPGPFCEEIGGIEGGETITVYELSQDGFWYKTDYLGDDQIGWVWIDLVTVTGDASLIPQGNVPGCIGCGDEICNGDETCNSCPGDCGECCGNGTCEADYGEDCGTCEADCGACCGNGTCEADRDETCDTCKADCGDCCGDDSCDADYGEDMSTCPEDCTICGDGHCDRGYESCDTCAADCPLCCGDGYCGDYEEGGICDLDCGDICGNGTCEPWEGEGCTTCPEDCLAMCAPSDRALKENVEPVDSRAVLEALLEVPIVRWNYIEDGATVTHMGPMAQDFYSAYGLGDTDRMINLLDSGGVSMAAIQGMYEIVEEQQAQIDALAARQARSERWAIAASVGGLVLIAGAFAAGVWAGRRRP